MSQTPAQLDWTEAVRRQGSADRERFVESNVDLVRYVALRLAARLPSSVELEELMHDGILGLFDAIEKFNPARGVRFRTYAERRVRGAILDGIRQRDWHPRAVRRNQRQLEETMMRLASKRGRAASEEELATELGLEISQLHQRLQDASSGPLLPLDELPSRTHPVATAESDQPHEALERKQLLALLADELTRLPERERQVLELYYHEGLNMKEVGALLGVTESRVCQLHGQAATRLRGVLRERLQASAIVGSTSGARA